MKKIVLVASVLMISTLSAGFVFASCEQECDGPFQTCLNICRQTTKVDSPEAAKCVDNCLTGVSGCVKRCKARDRKSENTMRMKTVAHAVNDSTNREEHERLTVTSDKGLFTEPVPCTEVNAVNPIIVAAGNNPCPGKVYCANGPCEHCCEWGYFYSTPCDCRCYKSSSDASASGCRTYFRCN